MPTPESGFQKEAEEAIGTARRKHLEEEKLRILRENQKIREREKAIRETEEGIIRAGVTVEDIEELNKAAGTQRLRKPDPQI